MASRFDLERDIQFDTRVVSAVFDEQAGVWSVTTDGGEVVEAQFMIMATGCLSMVNYPEIPGIDSFAGQTVHTGQWPADGVDLAGKRVGIIGTGSSSVQATPVIAAEAAELVVFQRTAQYAVPARNRPVTPADVAEIKADYAGFRARNKLEWSAQARKMPRGGPSALAVDKEERDRIYEERWQYGGFPFFGSFDDLLRSRAANDTAAEFVRRKIRATVEDPAVAELLCPDYIIACKRPVLDTGYFQTFNRSNVRLVDIKANPIEAITPAGVQLGAGAEVDLDVIVFATGFDSMTGALLAIDIRGRDGIALGEAWSAGPRNYLGLTVAGFPNLFTITGPGSPSVLTNMVVAIEQHIEWVAECLTHVRERGLRRIEADVGLDMVDWIRRTRSCTVCQRGSAR